MDLGATAVDPSPPRTLPWRGQRRAPTQYRQGSPAQAGGQAETHPHGGKGNKNGRRSKKKHQQGPEETPNQGERAQTRPEAAAPAAAAAAQKKPKKARKKEHVLRCGLRTAFASLQQTRFHHHPPDRQGQHAFLGRDLPGAGRASWLRARATSG